MPLGFRHPFTHLRLSESEMLEFAYNLAIGDGVFRLSGIRNFAELRDYHHSFMEEKGGEPFVQWFNLPPYCRMAWHLHPMDKRGFRFVNDQHQFGRGLVVLSGHARKGSITQATWVRKLAPTLAESAPDRVDLVGRFPGEVRF